MCSEVLFATGGNIMQTRKNFQIPIYRVVTMIAPVGADDHIGPPNTLSRGEGVSEADGSGMREEI